MVLVSSVQLQPSAVARAMPSKYPVSLVSGVLRSPCASNQTMFDAVGAALNVPRQAWQFPEKTRGTEALEDAARANAASILTHCWISFDAQSSTSTVVV